MGDAVEAAGSGVRLVLLARGLEGEPRGAWFEPAHGAELVQAAARAGQRLVEVGVRTLRALDPDMPAGQMMGPGQHGALPTVRPATFEALVALPPVVVAPRQVAEAAKGEGQARPVPKQVVRIGKRTIKPGTVVLASVAADDGWWEAEVVAVAPGGVLRLRWRDFPGLDVFDKAATAVAVAPLANVR